MNDKSIKTNENAVRDSMNSLTQTLANTTRELYRVNATLNQEQELNKSLTQELAEAKETIRQLERRLVSVDPDISGLLS